MSRPNRFPVYTSATGADGPLALDPCGHQHNTKAAAAACAENRARRHRGRRFTVLKRLKPRTGEDEGRAESTGFFTRKK